MEKLSQITRIALHNTTLKKGIMLSVVVGTALNIINQGNFIINDQLPDISISKIFLTYITPFVTSVYSTTTALMRNKEEENNQ